MTELELPRAQASLVGPNGVATTEFYDFLLALVGQDATNADVQAEIAALAARVAALESASSLTATISGFGAIQVTGSLEAGFVQVSLENDNTDPGATYYYGTGPDGVKGFFPISDALVQGDGIALTVNADGTIDIAHADTSTVTDISANFTGGTVPGEISFTFDQFGHVLTRTITGRTLDHNDTGAKQGGTAGEYFHFTESEHTGLLPWASIDPASKADTSALASYLPLTAGISNPVSGDIFSSTSDFRLGPNTSDGSDTGRTSIMGGGTTSRSRGAYVSVYGEEHPVQAGNVLVTAGMSGDVFLLGGVVRPQNDNSISIGEASARWTEVFAVNGAINTSDVRDKQDLRDLTPTEIACATELARLPCAYRWIESVQQKGNNARLHCSPTVQSVIAVMESHGIDPFRWGFVCYDEWEEAPEYWEEWPKDMDENGNVIREAGRELVQKYRPAGNRYSLRPSELAWFVIRGQAARQDALEARIAALEG